MVEFAFGLDHRVVELGVALLAVGQLHVQFLEARLGGHAALLQRLQLGIHLAQVGVDLLAARARLLGLLGQAQGLHLQLVRAALSLGGLAARHHQALGSVGEGGVGAHQGRARLLGDERLCLELLVEVLDFLRARQQAGLLVVGRVEAHAVRADGVAAGDVDGLAGL